jgi:hypothetical protein
LEIDVYCIQNSMLQAPGIEGNGKREGEKELAPQTTCFHSIDQTETMAE